MRVGTSWNNLGQVETSWDDLGQPLMIWKSKKLHNFKLKWDKLGQVGTSWDELGLVGNQRNYRILTLKKRLGKKERRRI